MSERNWVVEVETYAGSGVYSALSERHSERRARAIAAGGTARYSWKYRAVRLPAEDA